MMESASWAATGSGKPSSELKRVIGELTRGREMADQLLSMLRETGNDDGASVLRTGSMVEKILDSFTGSLSILGTTAAGGGGSGGESDEFSQISSYMINSPAVPNTEDSGESCKKPAPKDRRGCYKRRRTTETWTKETPTFYEDGHAWRKYGQKVILNAKHPRNYFRCTHKYDQECRATKQVQKIQDEPATLYRTTYHGRHTCKKLTESAALPPPHQLIMDAAAHDNSSIIWSFQSSQQLGHIDDDDDYKPRPGVMMMAMKQHDEPHQDHNKEVVSYQTKSSLSHSGGRYHDDTNNYIMTTSLNYGGEDQLTTFDNTSSVHNNNHLSAFSSDGSDHGGDVYSCTASTVHNNNTGTPPSMDIGTMMDFDDYLPDF